MRRLIRHIQEWRAVLAEAGDRVTWRTWLRMIRGALSPSVPRSVWRARARTCVRCPLFDRELRRCAGPWLKGQPTGCGCYLPWFLRIPAPYPKGCWGREHTETLGWSSHPPELRARG